MTGVMVFGSTICYVPIFPLGQIVALPTFNDPHLAAVLLKKYFRDLPDPNFSPDVVPHHSTMPTSFPYRYGGYSIYPRYAPTSVEALRLHPQQHPK